MRLELKKQVLENKKFMLHEKQQLVCELGALES